MDSAKFEPGSSTVGGLVVTGSRVGAMTESEMLDFWDSSLRISSGPNASSAL